MSEWGMVRTKTETPLQYFTLNNKWKNNEKDEKCYRIHRTPFTFKIDF